MSTKKWKENKKLLNSRCGESIEVPLREDNVIYAALYNSEIYRSELAKRYASYATADIRLRSRALMEEEETMT